MKHVLPFALLLLVALSACKSTKKAYEQGDYETAVVNSIERLRKSPNNKKSRQTLAAAYPRLVQYMEDRIERNKRSSNPLRWERVVGDYYILNRVYDEILRAPGAQDIVPDPINFQSEYNAATLKAAEARYALGEQEIAIGRQGDREAAKTAFAHFDRALELRPGFRDAENKKFEAQDLATLYVQLEPIPVHSRALALTNEFFENQIAEYIASTTFNPFIRFLTPDQAGRTTRQPDQIVRMIFDDFVVGQAYVKETVVQRKRDSVVVGQVTVGDSTIDAYGTVEADVHRFQKELSSAGLLDVKIIDRRNGRLISQR
ncbi:MAG: hypothetical protein AAF206_29035, partial [Bacteroidota bacterium]